MCACRKHSLASMRQAGLLNPQVSHAVLGYSQALPVKQVFRAVCCFTPRVTWIVQLRSVLLSRSLAMHCQLIAWLDQALPHNV